MKPRLPIALVLWSGLAASLFLAVAVAFTLVRHAADNRTIAALAAGEDVAVSANASPVLQFARARFLLARERFDEARPHIDRAASRGDRSIAVAVLYDAGNAQLRRALDIVSTQRYDDTIAAVSLAKEHYLRALRLDPDQWDAKLNLDVAMRLVRDLPDGKPKGDEETPEAPERLWTDLPGKPRGGP